MPDNYSNGNISQDKINAMLKMASQKMGMTPQQLRSILSDQKQTDELLSKLNAQSSEQLKSMTKNPKNLEEYIKNNPKAKKMLEDLLGG